MTMNFEKKLSHLIQPGNIDLIYDAIWVNKVCYRVGQQVELFGGSSGYPVMNIFRNNKMVEIVLQRDGFLFTTFKEYNDDEVFDASDDIFIPYTADEAMLFQLSTLEDLHWLKPKHAKKFKRIHDAYILEYSDD